MSDFFSSGWSVFVSTVTIVGLIACLGLLFGASRRKVMSASDNTTICRAVGMPMRSTASKILRSIRKCANKAALGA